MNNDFEILIHIDKANDLVYNSSEIFVDINLLEINRKTRVKEDSRWKEYRLFWEEYQNPQNYPDTQDSPQSTNQTV
jgi:hypothetical protein